MKTAALIIGLATLASSPAFAKGGTDILHFAYSEVLTNTGIEPSATGRVTASENVQGNANNQTLTVTASGLTAGTDYAIVATVNGAGTTNLGTFTTDGKGKLTAQLSGGGKSHGKKSTPLPDGFDISQVVQVDVINIGSSQTVLSVVTSDPGSLKYLVKRNLNNGGSANGTLSIKTSNGTTKFSVTATGLDASTTYQIVFNGAPVGTVDSDSHGKLKVSDGTLLPANILDLQTVEIWDGTNTAVLATATPLP